ncbi:MAG: multicopper oxidase domain-containing protein [Methylococcales bacterium]|nr:multicopper oxidase domain-containing protein [Methylococcales bacterium]
MQNCNIYKKSQLSLAIALTLASSAPQLANAGAGWGDSTNANGESIKTATYYANSPSGILPAADCFDTKPPSSGPFDTSVPHTPNDGTAIQITCDSGTALRKFVDPVASIPVAVPDTTTYPGSDYYEIGVVEYTQRMHSDLAKATTLRGYVQISTNGSGISLGVNLPNGAAASAVAKPAYLGPILSTTQGRPVRIKFYNLLPAGSAGNLHLPVDETITGAGVGPDGKTIYQQNRAEIHLHGGDNPWISDGTPHQWILPASDELALKTTNPAMARGVSAKNVPDMPDPGPGAMTYYYPNNQSGRLMFYHDHSIGITRLNVYSGIAAGYLINDLPGVGENQADLKALLPTEQIPLIIQDKTFVAKDIAMQDAKWDTRLGQEGDLWYPHVYETNQDPNSADGTNPVGRWDWGNWFWPVFPSVYDLPTGEVKAINTITKLHESSTTPEAFMDTPVINGVAYPTLEVDAKAYRFRILNAANDRFINLGLYLAADKQTTDPDVPTNSQNTVLCDGSPTRPDQTPLLTTDCTEVKMVVFGSGYVPPHGAAYTPDGTQAFPTTGGITDTGWGAQVDGLFPQGAPDPATAGPNIIQIGNEAGLLASPLDIPSTPLNFEYNKRSVTVLNVQERGLFMGPAERADVLIDFSKYAGQTLIVYNDAPAPTPASDPRIDYYTGNGDQTGAGGAPNTQPGYGPNTRTIMQIHVKGTPGVQGTPGPSIADLNQALPKAYASSQNKPIVPEPEYNTSFATDTAYTAVAPSARTNARIYTGSVYIGKYNGLSFKTPESITYLPAPVCSTPAACDTAIATQRAKANNGLVTAIAGATISAYTESKAIQELFDPTYGRMNATLGVELPFTSALTQTTIPLGYVDPVTEKIADGETQFWKITHNGVDSHPVHFHLVNVQVINRIGWDGTVKKPYGDEAGWKETVKMHPLEDIVVAVRAKKPLLGALNSSTKALIPNKSFGLPNSVRLMDPTQPEGSLTGITQVDPATGTPSVVSNAMQNYGWEYVWHCHILGHEENDFMRPVAFDAKEGAPTQPSNLAINGGTLTWTDNATTEYTYKVERAAILPQQTCTTVRGRTTCITTNGPGAFIDLTASVLPAQQTFLNAPLANAESFIDTAAVVANTDYRYRVTAIGAAGNSASVTVDRIVPAAPVAPVLAVATGTTTTGTTLTWTEATAIAKITSFQVFQVGNNTPIATLANTATTYNVTGLTPTTTYQFYIVAVNGTLASANSNTVSVTTASPVTGNLTAPSNVSIQRTSLTAATLSWIDASNNETSFQVQSSTNGTTWTNVGTAITRTQAQGTSTGAALTAALTVSNSTNASYRVNAVNSTTTASSASVLLNDSVAPAAAGLLTVTKTPITLFGLRLGTTVNLSWTDNANNNASYTSQFSTNGGTSWSNISATLAGNATTSTQTVLGTTAATYQYRVQAVNSVGSVISTNVLSIVLP